MRSESILLAGDARLAPVEIDDTRAIQPEQIVRVARGAELRLGDATTRRIITSRGVMDRAVENGLHVYGTTGGLGHNKDKLVNSDLSDFQRKVLLAHDAAVGDPYPEVVARATVASRVAGFAQGGGGVRIEFVRALTELLNHRISPIIREASSVGAGDLMAMAAVGKTVIGAGKVLYEGVPVLADDAYSRAGIRPYVLGYREASALLCSNALATGHAALVVDEACEVLALADIAAAMSLEAVSGNVSVMHPRLSELKPLPGLAETAEHLSSLLAGSYLYDPDVTITLQDPISFRTIPQVHASVREAMRAARDAVLIQISSAEENPVVSIADDTVIHNGNFSPIQLVFSMETLRAALAQLARVAERRVNHVNFQSTGTPHGGTGPPRSPRFELLLYAAAARLAELRHIATPVIDLVPPLDQEIEDHAANAPYSVRQTECVIDLLRDILIIELLTATYMISHREQMPTLGAGTRPYFDIVNDVITGAPRETARGEVVDRVKTALLGAPREIASPIT